MSALAICDKFKWTLRDVDDLTMIEYNGICSYLKKLRAEEKKAMRKSKRR